MSQTPFPPQQATAISQTSATPGPSISIGNTGPSGFSPLPASPTNELVNQKTGEVLPLPSAFQVPQVKGIKMLNQPRDYRTMLEKTQGYFSCNDINKGGKIKMRILNWRNEHGVRFSDAYPEPETVVQVIFIDEQDLVSTVLFRTSSMKNFYQLIDNIFAEGKALAQVVVTATMEKVTSKAGYTFHIAKFSYEDNTEENLREIMFFAQNVPDALYCFRELPREIAQEQHAAAA